MVVVVPPHVMVVTGTATVVEIVVVVVIVMADIVVVVVVAVVVVSATATTVVVVVHDMVVVVVCSVVVGHAVSIDHHEPWTPCQAATDISGSSLLLCGHRTEDSHGFVVATDNSDDDRQAKACRNSHHRVVVQL